MEYYVFDGTESVMLVEAPQDEKIQIGEAEEDSTWDESCFVF